MVNKSIILRGFLVILICFFAFAPIYWMLSTSVTTNREIFQFVQTFFPQDPTLEGYRSLIGVDALYGVRFTSWLFNSVKVASISSILAITLAALAGYIMSRYSIRGLNSLGYIVLITQMIPGVVLLIPLYDVIRILGLIDTHLSLIAIYTALAAPFATWMLRGYFNTIPKELEESAMIDGSTKFAAFYRIILPLAKPGLAATFLFSFILSWNEYLFASVLLNTAHSWTLPVALASFRGQYVMEWNYLMAGSTLITLPVFFMFLYLQKHLVSGAMAGAVKG